MVKKIVLITVIIAVQIFSQATAEKVDSVKTEEKKTEAAAPETVTPAKEKAVETKVLDSLTPASKGEKKSEKEKPTKQEKPKPTGKPVPVKKVQSIPSVDNTDVATAVEIPGGVLFGEFAKEDGPFLIKGSIIVPSGQTLEFSAGSKIYIGGKYSTITVFGQLIAKGTPTEPVIFQSANKNPKPWDWDRIYCRSRRRSTFEYCVIRHSNYGVFVENGSVEVRNCTFEHNSLHGLVIKNSDAVVSTTLFKRGHVCALLLQAGANVNADSLTVKNNITGVACTEKSYFKLEKGVIKGNKNGVAVREGASVNIIAADITSNSTGVVSEKEINKKLREMVYNNTHDMKIVTPAEMEKILKPPQEVKSIVLPKSKTDIQVSNSFKPGFSALKTPREATASFIGNVSTGFKYFSPNSHLHPVDSILYPQTKYLGEHDSNDAWYSKFQPELIVFAQGKRGLLDVNLNMDMYVNNWVDKYAKANLFTMSMNYADQHIILGDYYENISEPSISGRKLRGVKYTGSFLPMGRGTKRIEFKLAAGQSEPKKDVGDPETELFGDIVDTGGTVRQQLTYVANIAVKPAHNVTISMRGIIAHDQDAKPIFSDEIADTAVPDPISAATGCIDANVILFDGKMEVTAELDMGAHDTVDSNDWSEIAWYRPKILEALPRVFGVIRPDSNNYAFLLDVQGRVKGFDLGASFMEIAEKYFSAGNPYLEPDRRIVTFDAERQFNENLSSQFGYEYERTSVSYVFAPDTPGGDEESPTNNNIFDLGGSYAFGENKPAVTANYGLRLQKKDDMDSYEYLEVDTAGDTNNVSVKEEYEYKRIDNSVSLELRQRFANGMDYSLKYQFVNKNDLSDYLDEVSNANNDDTWENTITGRFGFRIKRRVRNKTTIKVKFKNEKDDDKERIDFKISDNLRVNIIPRKLSLILKGEFRNQVEELDNDSLAGVRDNIDLNQKAIEAELKYAITSRLSVIAMGKYENYYDEAESSTENYTVKIGGLHLTYLF